MFSPQDKVAVVTGAYQGVGLAVVKRFKEAGADIVMLDIKDAAKEIAKELGCTFIKM